MGNKRQLDMKTNEVVDAQTSPAKRLRLSADKPSIENVSVENLSPATPSVERSIAKITSTEEGIMKPTHAFAHTEETNLDGPEKKLANQQHTEAPAQPAARALPTPASIP